MDKNHLTIAVTYNNIGLVYEVMGENVKALKNHQKALDIRKKSLNENHPSIGQSYNNIGSVYRAMGENSIALENLHKALDIQKEALDRNHSDIANNYSHIGKVHQAMGSYAKALEYHYKALSIRKKALNKSHPAITDSHNDIGLAHDAKGEYDKAYDHLQKSFVIYLNSRENLLPALSAQQKQVFLEKNTSYIENLFLIATAYGQDLSKQGKVLAEENLIKEVINHWLTYKGSILASENDLIAFVSNSDDSAIKQDYQQWQQHKQDYARLSQVTSKSKQVHQRLESLQQKINVQQYKISKLNPDKQPQNIKLKSIAKLLQANELYLDFGKLRNNYYIFSITREGFSFSVLPVADSLQLDELVELFNGKDGDIQSVIGLIGDYGADVDVPEGLKAKSRQTLAQLYKILIDNPYVKPLLKTKTSLIISPDGALRLLPFEALYDEKNGQYLIQQKDIRYIASGKELVRVYRQGNKTAKGDTILFANPNYNKTTQAKPQDAVIKQALGNARGVLDDFNITELPGTETEANNIKAILDNTPIYHRWNNATEDRLLKTRSPKILHIATHGFFDADSVNLGW